MSSKNNRKGQVRCLNCFERFTPPQAASQATCPQCNMEWRLTWSSPTFVKIRGPLWNKLKSDST